MLTVHRHGGVSLIELMVAITVLSIVLAAGLPSFGLWMQNLQTRTAAESIQNGLQLALTEAVRRNAPVRFDLTDKDGRVTWNVGCVNAKSDCPATIQGRSADEGGINARAGGSADAIPNPLPPTQFSKALAAGAGLPGGVTFDGLGRMVNVGADLARIDVTNAVRTDARRLVVTIGALGQVRMCDPALSAATNPQGC